MEIAASSVHRSIVKGHTMSFISLGKGKPIVFVHGIPTSSYVWRKILPSISLRNQCIAVDLIGMGGSDKPDISYSVAEHIEYFKEFIDTLELQQPFTLVMHGWGSIIGLSYARQHTDNIKGLVMIEPYMNLPEEYSEVSSTVNELIRLAADDPERLRYLFIEENYMVEKIMPMLMAIPLSEEDFNTYRKPFQQKEHRKVLLQFALEQPHREINSPVFQMVSGYTSWLQETSLPKLLMYSTPGFLTRMNNVIWAMNHLSHLTVVEVGKDFHYLPETCAPKIVETMSNWLREEQK